MKHKLDILIAEDHDFFIDGIKTYLEKIPEINKIFTALNGKEALQVIENKNIDILISDIEMPEINGIELSRKLKQEKGQIKIIIVTQFCDKSHILPLFKIKTDAIINKIDAKNEIKEAIETVLKNRNYYSKNIQETINSILLGKKEKKRIGIIPHLTRREKQLLPYISEGLSNAEIAELLEKLLKKIILSPHTIEGHRKNLYIKFEAHNAAQLAKKTGDLGLLD